jgi:CRP-like cAMP-binding protein
MQNTAGPHASQASRADLMPRLRELPQFRAISDAEFAAVANVVRPIKVRSGDILFEQGARGDTMLFVAEGRLKTELVTGPGQTTDLGPVTAGQVVGEMAALDPAPRAAQVRAASDGLVFELGVSGLRELRTTAPAVAATLTSSIIADVTARLRSIDQRIEQELNPHAQRGKEPAKSASGESDKQKELSPFGRLWARFFG